MNELKDINDSITSRQPNELHRIILYGDCKFKDNFNKRILIAISTSSKTVIDLIKF